MAISLEKVNYKCVIGILYVLVFLLLPAGAYAAAAEADPVVTVICNVVNFVQNLGLPIMTGVILGSSIMAIFGRLAWPAIVMLVVFTAIFFGAGTVMEAVVKATSYGADVVSSCSTA